MTKPGPTSCRAPSFLPSTAVLELTYRCNHACLFCSCPWYASGGTFDRRAELSVEDWLRVIDRLCAMGCGSLAFTGGEPLLKEGWERLLEHAASRTVEHIETEDGALRSRPGPPKLYLLSNGRAVDDGVLDLCARLGVNLSMSLPGLRTFGEHTGTGLGPERILELFSRARDRGVGTTVGVTVTALNIDELYETLAEALLAGADTVLLNRFLPGGRGLEHAGRLAMTREMITRMLDTAEEVLTTANRYGSVGTELPKCFFDASRYVRLKVGTRCSAALDFFVVGPSGFTRVCNHSQIRLAHIDRVDDLRRDPYWRRFVMKDYLPDSCRDCSMLTVCDGGCREAAHICGGAVDALDPAWT